jgi:hypothetical protein
MLLATTIAYFMASNVQTTELISCAINCDGSVTESSNVGSLNCARTPRADGTFKEACTPRVLADHEHIIRTAGNDAYVLLAACVLYVAGLHCVVTQVVSFLREGAYAAAAAASRRARAAAAAADAPRESLLRAKSTRMLA